MKKYIITSLFVLTVGAGLAEAAKQSMLTVGETTHGDVRTTVNTNATRSNSNFTELYARKQPGVTDWTTNGAGYTYAEDDLVKYGDKIYIALGAHVQDVDTPDVSSDFSEWAGGEGGTGAVSSVNTQTGDVVLDADDISDTTTTNKFVTAADKTKLSNLSGTNTGDQDLSSLATKANVLQLNNTTAFTPSADYHPATKKYVDDSITAGGGYTDEQAQDATGAMVTGNTESGIAVVYDDATNKLNFTVSSQTDNNFTNAYKTKLDGIAAGAQVDTDDQAASEVATSVTNFNNNLSSADTTVQKALDTLDNLAITGYTDEQAQDAVGSMVTGNTETGIAVTYDDATAKLNFVLDDDLVDLSDGSISYSKVSPPGSDTQVLFNDASAFGGDSGLTYNKTTDTLTAVGAFAAPTFTINAADTARKLLLPNNTSYTPAASENSIYTEANKIKVSENGVEKTILNSADIGVASGVQAYNQYLPTWPSTVNATEVSYLDGVTSAIQTQITGKENSLGNPGTSGWVLSSTTAGVRSWIAPGGMTYPASGIPKSTGSAWDTSYQLDTDLTSVSASDDTIPSAKATKAALDLKANATGIAFEADALTDLKILETGSTYTALIDDTVAYGSTYDAKHIWSIDKVGSLLAGKLATTVLDDTKGNGDTGFVWSADKVYDQLALKQAADADLTTWAGVTPGTGIATALAINVGSAGAPVLFNGAGGTPSSLVLTNATIANSTSLPGTCTLGQVYYDTDADTDGELYVCRATNTWKAVDDDGGAGGLATTDIDTSSELRAILGDETGTGALVFAGGDIGAATATTATAGDNDTSVATTAFVQTAKKSGVQPVCAVIPAAVAADDYPIFKAPAALTITGGSIHVYAIGGTNVVGGLDECTGTNGTCGSVTAVDSDITGTAGSDVADDGTLTNGGIASGNWIQWHTTSVSGTNTSVSVCFSYTLD